MQDYVTENQPFEAYLDKHHRRLLLEGYMIHRGFIPLTLPEFRHLPADYAGKLFLTLQEMDKMAGEQRQREIEDMKRSFR